LRRKLFTRNHQESLSRMTKSQKEQSKSLNERKKNLMVDHDEINMSNVFTLKKVETVDPEIENEANTFIQ